MPPPRAKNPKKGGRLCQNKVLTLQLIHNTINIIRLKKAHGAGAKVQHARNLAPKRRYCMKVMARTESPPDESRPAREVPALYLQHSLISHLLAAQNLDGGWGYHAGASSAVEPSSWALMALSTVSGKPGLPQAADRGFRWLSGSQLPDGSWPPFPGQLQGCWATSLACGACSVYVARLPGACETPLSRGLEWLCCAVPGEGSWRSLLRFRLSPSCRLGAPSAYGWSWTQNTSSWVEPTAYALLALRAAPATLLPAKAKDRIERAERFLFDGRCRDAGWDVGNPPDAGIDRTPQTEPTAWALMALSNYANRADVKEGIEWLETKIPLLKGLAKRAVVQLCFQAYGRAAALLLSETWTLEELPLEDILAASWMTLAASGSWQAPTPFLKGN